MPVPTLTHLQFLVLQILGGSQRPGRYLRAELAKNAQRKSLPAFYQMMARLEDANFVEGSYRRIDIDDQPVQERCYKITAPGLKAYHSTRDFYFQSSLNTAKGGVIHG